MSGMSDTEYDHYVNDCMNGYAHIYRRVKVRLPRGASAQVIDRGDHLELANLVVHESRRNRGIGTEVVRRVMRLQRRIRLEAVPYEGCQRALHRFYRRLGFAASRQGRRTFFEWTPVNADSSDRE